MVKPRVDNVMLLDEVLGSNIILRFGEERFYAILGELIEFCPINLCVSQICVIFTAVNQDTRARASLEVDRFIPVFKMQPSFKPTCCFIQAHKTYLEKSLQEAQTNLRELVQAKKINS